MKKLMKLLQSRSGQGAPLILAVVLVCLLLSCVVFEYMRLLIVAQGVRDAAQSAIVDVAAENWDEAYPGLREGYSGGYQLSGSSWYENVSNGNVYDRMRCWGWNTMAAAMQSIPGKPWNTGCPACGWTWRIRPLPPRLREGSPSLM